MAKFKKITIILLGIAAFFLELVITLYNFQLITTGTAKHARITDIYLMVPALFVPILAIFLHRNNLLNKFIGIVAIYSFLLILINMFIMGFSPVEIIPLIFYGWVVWEAKRKVEEMIEKEGKN